MCRTNTNTHAVCNKHAGGIFFSKSTNVQTKIRLYRGEFFLKINKRAGQILILGQDGINMQGEFFLKNNKHAYQNKAVQGELIN